MPQSIDIVLNAIDATGPATKSASSNIQRFAADASSANQTIAASAGGSSGGLAALLGGLFSLPTLAVAGGVAIAAFAFTFSSEIADAGASVIETITSMANGTFDWAKLFKDVVSAIVTGFAIIEFAFK